jgi:Spy/CpxP family protein refolding chaperone
MTTSRKWLVGAALLWTVAATLIGSGGIALAGPGGLGGPGMGPPMGDGMMGDGSMFLPPLLFRAADLTPDQQTKLHQIFAAHRDAFKSLFGRLHTANNDLAAKLVAPGDLATSDLTPMVNSIVQIRQQMMQEGLSVALEVRAILTSDQLKKLASARQQLESLHSQMRALLGGDGPGD